MRIYEVHLCGRPRLEGSCGTSFIKMKIRANYILEAKNKAAIECEKIMTYVRIIDCKEITV